jgi:hypothetical protein
MDPSIRPVAPGPNAPDPLRRRQGAQQGFDLERELARREDEPPSDDEPTAPREPTPVSPPADDEAGTHLDLTA